MKKSIAIVISVIILIQSFNFDIGDINKIPVLIDHFASHLKAGDSVSDFFSMHYGSLTSNHKGDHKEHEKLPFKHQHIDTHLQLVFILCTNNYPVEYSECISEKKIFDYKEPITNLVTSNVFQPPKQA